MNDMSAARAVSNLLPRCGAHSRRTGRPCKGFAMANGRCRMHGGNSRGMPGKANPAYRHGLRSQEYIVERREARKVLRVVRDMIAQATERPDG
jgi:hypothetical protein